MLKVNALVLFFLYLTVSSCFADKLVKIKNFDATNSLYVNATSIRKVNDGVMRSEYFIYSEKSKGYTINSNMVYGFCYVADFDCVNDRYKILSKSHIDVAMDRLDENEMRSPVYEETSEISGADMVISYLCDNR